jgi:alkaline phosphatase
VPTLAEMTTAALAMLAGHPQGFLLLIEGGRVDHAAHANDAAAILWDQLAFDDAVAQVRAFSEPRGDTLVVVTTDHGNANPGLNGMGPSYLDSTAHFERIASARASFSAIKALLTIQARAGQPPRAEDVRAIVLEWLGAGIGRDDASTVAAAVAARVPGVLNHQLSAFDGVLGQVLSNHWGVGWTGTTHTADLCPLMAFGPGRERLAGLKPNTALFADLLALMEIEFRNPAMTPAAASRLPASSPAAAEVVPA